ncbi:ribosome-binding factor A [Acidaminococcus fermentans]
MGFFRREIARRIDLRVAPVLSFHKDTSMEYSAHIESILHELKKEEHHE